MLDYNKDTEKPNGSDGGEGGDDASGDNSDSGSADQAEKIIEYVVVGIGFWWKEIIGISLLTAVLMNVLITKPLMRKFMEQSRRRLEAVINKKPDVVVVEVPVPVPSQPQLQHTPSLSLSTGSASGEFNWRQNDNGKVPIQPGWLISCLLN